MCASTTTAAAYVEILDDERASTAVGFDNGSPFVSKAWAAWCTRRNIRHLAPAPTGLAPTESRKIHPNPAARMGLRRRLPELSAPRSRAHHLDRLLQPPTIKRFPRQEATRQPPNSRLTNVPGIYT